MTAWLGLLALIAYAYGLGAAAVVVWRYYRGWLRWAPGVATLTYYGLALFIARPPAYQAVLDGVPYPMGDALRSCASAIAFGLSLLLITRLLQRAEGEK
ncbi:hypothetical protein [Deinococcus daejeonensis]|uniref:Transmembrane protein n=1 Tax=Deinococcus daejeonensis TaxID=1007098 RepID=A0ABQ2IVJ4_9DEIO|nr:hypothetical protein [Deinococcus daejeonensis]GGN32211.1 hypothetical protein GCM10010842_08680 [Deinococcus daejeonensis]